MTLKKSLVYNSLWFIATLLAIYFLDLGKGYLLIPIVFFISDLVLGAIYIQRNFYIKSINSLTPKKQWQLCLTFDDGIHAERTPMVLDILKEKQVKAVFFLIGKNIEGNEHIVKRMKDEGHQIGNHSYEHSAWFDLKSSQAMLEEIMKTNTILESIIGEKVTLFRPPYGVTNPNLAKAIRKSKLHSIGWSLRSMDTVAKSKEQLLDKLTKKTKPQDIILLHDRCQVTVDALTDYIDDCQRQGYTFVPLNVSHENGN